MAVFVICRVGQPSEMQELLNKEFPNDHYQLADGQWLVATSGTARALSDRLEKVSPNQNHGDAVIMRVASYWGRAPSDTWEWMYDRVQATNGS